MLIHRLTRVALTLLVLGAAAGAGYSLRSLAASPREGEPHGERSTAPARREPRPPEGSPPAAPGRMTVVGRVLDPSGKPASRTVRSPMNALFEPPAKMPVPHGCIDPDGSPGRRLIAMLPPFVNAEMFEVLPLYAAALLLGMASGLIAVRLLITGSDRFRIWALVGEQPWRHSSAP